MIDADMDIGDYAAGVDDRDLVELEPLVDRCGVLLVARQAGKTFGKHRIEAALFGSAHQGDQAVALKQGGTSLGAVCKNIANLVPVALREISAQSDLVINRALLLKVT